MNYEEIKNSIEVLGLSELALEIGFAKEDLANGRRYINVYRHRDKKRILNGEEPKVPTADFELIGGPIWLKSNPRLKKYIQKERSKRNNLMKGV